MKLTPQDVQSLKDTSKWAGFTYENQDGTVVGQGLMDMDQHYQQQMMGGSSLNNQNDGKLGVDNGDNF